MRRWRQPDREASTLSRAPAQGLRALGGVTCRRSPRWMSSRTRIIYRTAVVDAVGGARALGEFSGDGEAFGNAREPIAQVFAPDAGGEFLFVVNHFKWKGSPVHCPATWTVATGRGHPTPPASRRQWHCATGSLASQATWTASAGRGLQRLRQRGSAGRCSTICGFSDVERALGVETSVDPSRASVSLDAPGQLAALARATGADIWNINTGESVALEYSRYNSHGTIFYAADAYRSATMTRCCSDAPLPDAAQRERFPRSDQHQHGSVRRNDRAVACGCRQPGAVHLLRDDLGASFASAMAQPTIDVLNALDLTASAVGNHEFDQGWLDLRDRIQSAADWDYLARTSIGREPRARCSMSMRWSRLTG